MNMTSVPPSEWSEVPPDVAAEAVTNLLRAADRAARCLEGFFADYGLTGQQFNVLRILRGAGTPLPTMEIANRLIQQTPGSTGLVDRLEAKGLIVRERSTTDRRVWLCSLTAEGRALLTEVDGDLAAANLRALDAAREGLEALGDALSRAR
jgi:DNA-binding MarR family transcriptional regulator